MTERAGEAFWRFSLAFYGRPGVSEALLALQDRGGADVNLILYALWLGLSGRGALERGGLDAAEPVARLLREAAVDPLRELRRRLKGTPDGDVALLRERVKGLELDAERIVQRRLAALAPPPAAAAPRGERIAAAEAGLALCLGPALAASGEAAVLRRAAAAWPFAGPPPLSRNAGEGAERSEAGEGIAARSSGRK